MELLMMSSAVSWLRRFQFVGLAGYATYLSLVPNPGEIFESFWDKFLHTLCYGVLTLSLRLALGPDRFGLKAALGLFAYSCLIEVGQYFLPPRQFSFEDMLANLTGVMVGLVLVRGIWDQGLALRTRLLSDA